MNKKLVSIAQRAGLVGALVATVARPAAVAHATPGELDRSYGNQGVVEQWQETGSSPWYSPQGVWPAGGDRVVVQAARMQRLTRTGAQDPSFGSLFVRPAARFRDGRWLVTRFPDENSSGSPVQPMDANGHPLATAGAFVSSIARLPGQPGGGTFAALADGTALYLTIDQFTGRVAVAKVKLDGTVLHQASFGLPTGTSPNGAIASGTGAIVYTSTGVLRLRNDGSRDSRWGLPTIRQSGASQMVPWDKGGVAVVSANVDAKRYELTLISHTGRVARHIVLASATFNYYGGPFASFNYALAVDPRGRLLLTRSDAVHSGITVSRYVGGRVDRTFGVNGLTYLKASQSVDAAGVTVMPDGRIVVLGELQRSGTIYGHNNALIPGFEDHGTVLWRLQG
ncbi:hypothetical protein DSM104299_00214 [Baekduia alba]|nr:hypothetical protein DSM104299_00214 [Baekduia alba]